MISSKFSFDSKSLDGFFYQCSKGDENHENNLRKELTVELVSIQSKLHTDMEAGNWQSISYTVSRLKSIFHIIEQNSILDELNKFPDVNVVILNRLQKEEVVEKVIQLLSHIIVKISK